MGLDDLKKQAEEGLEKAKETFGEENVEKAVDAAKDKAAEVDSALKDKFLKCPDGRGRARGARPLRASARHCVPSPTP